MPIPSIAIDGIGGITCLSIKFRERKNSRPSDDFIFLKIHFQKIKVMLTVPQTFLPKWQNRIFHADMYSPNLRRTVSARRYTS